MAHYHIYWRTAAHEPWRYAGCYAAFSPCGALAAAIQADSQLQGEDTHYTIMPETKQ